MNIKFRKTWSRDKEKWITQTDNDGKMKTEIIVKPDSDLIKTLKKALESEFNIKVERADVRILVSGKREKTLRNL